MSRAIGKLSILKLNALIKARQPGMHADGGGLYLRIDARHHSAAWVFRYRNKVTFRLRDMGLGSYPAINLKDARARAAELRTQHGKGLDPIDVKRQNLADIRIKLAQAKTFGQCAESFIQKERHGWGIKTHHKWRQTVDVHCKLILKKSIQDVSADDIIDILKPIWFKTTYSGTRVRGRIESIFEHARELKIFTGDNPAAWRGSLRAHLPKPSDISKQTHHAALPYVDVPEFMGKLSCLGVFERSGTLSHKSLAMVLLTACRVGEVVGAKWSEIDFKSMTWTIPSNRMKTRVEHVIPLSPSAFEILSSLQGDESEFVFPSDRLKKGREVPITIASPYKVMRELAPGYTVHGLRATFRSWAGAVTDYTEDVAEAALSHQPKDKIKAAYMRDKLVEKRRSLMNDWDKYCLKISGHIA